MDTEGHMDTKDKTQLLHPELSYAVTGAAMNVHRELGPGWDESAYHAALLHALDRQGIKAKSKMRGILDNHGLTADEYELDILVEDTIVLELKHLIGPFAPVHHLQLINYLKFWNKNLGILINFGLERLQYKRVPFTPVAGNLNHTGPRDELGKKNNKIAEQIDSLFHSILATHGLGYSVKTCRGLFETECTFRHIQCNVPSVNLHYKDVAIGERPVDAYSLDSTVLISITALSDRSSATDLARLLSYMRQIGANTGVLANFGKTSLDLRYLTQ
jgi:GxxExxY protein